MSRILRIIVASIAAVCCVWVNLGAFFNAGSVIGLTVFGLVIVICVFWKPFCGLICRMWSKIAGKLALIVTGALLTVCVGLCLFFSVNMIIYAERPADDTKAVIVLGCQVRGEVPSTMLQGRLNAAWDVLNEYPEAVCVVSGGQGSGEDITEAEAMRRYLLEKGIAGERIIKEDKSVSTRENIGFSAKLLEERGIDGGVVICTNEFHQYRADIYASESGLKNVGHHSSHTPFHNILNYWIREWAAIMAVRTGL